MQSEERARSPLPHACGKKRPFKVWDHRRRNKKGLVAASIEELIVRGREKLEYGDTEVVSAVLEADGTTVEDSEYFGTLSDNTVFLLLRESERWLPPGVDILRAALSCIPRIVCQTMESLDLRQEAPCWKIADNKGQVTVQLQWGNAPVGRVGAVSPGGRRTHIVVRGVGETPLGTQRKSPLPPPLPPHHYPPDGAPPPYRHPTPPDIRLPRQSSSLESGPDASSMAGVPPPVPHHQMMHQQHPPYQHQHQHHQHHFHHHHHAPGQRGGAVAPAQCDFHCCAMHSEGGMIRVKKTAATSPIQEHPHSHLHQQQTGTTNVLSLGSVPGTVSGRRSVGHVRFEDAVKDTVQTTINDRVDSTQQQPPAEAEESSESEGDNTFNEEGTSEKLLLLVDQLSVDRNKHLSIKDIGIILERLSSKIVDVQLMQRQRESSDCHNWTLRATIRGDALGDMGVIYHGHYYGIGEHPGSAATPQLSLPPAQTASGTCKPPPAPPPRQ